MLFPVLGCLQVGVPVAGLGARGRAYICHMTTPPLSLVVLVEDKGALVAALVARCVVALAGVTGDFECICGNDGGRAVTLHQLLVTRAVASWLKALTLARSFVHQAAHIAAQGQRLKFVDSPAEGNCLITIGTSSCNATDTRYYSSAWLGCGRLGFQATAVKAPRLRC